MRSPRLFRVVALLIGLVLGVALIIGRAAITAYVDTPRRQIVRFDGDWLMQADDEIGFVAPEHARTTFFPPNDVPAFHIFTNAVGGRVTEPTASAAIPRPDVVVVGGSFSWGFGMENERTFASRLQRDLGVEVENLAFPGYGTVQAGLTLQRHAALRPRLVIYPFIGDHIRRNLVPCGPSVAPFCLPVPYVAFDRAQRAYLHPPATNLFSPLLTRQYVTEMLLDRRFTTKTVLWTLTTDYLRAKESLMLGHPNDTDDMGTRTAGVAFSVSQLAATTRQLGARLLIVWIPGLEREQTDAAQRELTASLPADATFLDMSPVVKRYYEDPTRPLLRFDRDIHPNEHGHALMATEIARIIRDRDLLR